MHEHDSGVLRNLNMILYGIEKYFGVSFSKDFVIVYKFEVIMVIFCAPRAPAIPVTNSNGFRK